ncbi:MAG TPA: vanadium-dependent haloperoxidase [Steroidobacteraceae bacterium]|jgi:membrane-associated phospholipid phosphatase|nr:vanadium-dependent haloperoxidase [Steroidobacteraceae bacterium]
MQKYLTALALLCASISAPFGSANGAPVADADNPVIDWNKTLLTIVRTKGAQPPTVHPTRSFAILHAAIYDAVNSIGRTHDSFLVEVNRVSQPASEDAAAAAAAHEVLTALYPSFQARIDAQLEQFLAQLPDEASKNEGVRVGRAVAEAVLALRSDDGSDAAPIPYVFGSAPGNYQSTPPNFPSQPQFTHWSRVTPFLLRRADQYRPGPPPALTSDLYSDVFNQVKSVGIAGSTSATADQALTGKFWNGAIQNYWNEIAQTAAKARGLNTARSALLFALVNAAVADGVIAFYDAKYTYNFWRPVTAIRAGAADGNPETLADPTWLPQSGNTAPDPSYPGAHAAISGAAAHVLASFFGDQFSIVVTSEVMPGVERNFRSFSAAEQEASLSRIFAGVHFLSDETAGQKLGHEVAAFDIGRVLGPEEGGDSGWN